MITLIIGKKVIRITMSIRSAGGITNHQKQLNLCMVWYLNGLHDSMCCDGVGRTIFHQRKKI